VANDAGGDLDAAYRRKLAKQHAGLPHRRPLSTLGNSNTLEPRAFACPW
jgi:hypothetical protein